MTATFELNDTEIATIEDDLGAGQFRQCRGLGRQQRGAVRVLSSSLSAPDLGMRSWAFPACPSVLRADRRPAGEWDDAATGGRMRVAELLISKVSWWTTRTRAGTSARSSASSLFLVAIVCLSLAMVARSRASSPLSAPRSLMRW
jgi:hypothetical protein